MIKDDSGEDFYSFLEAYLAIFCVRSVSPGMNNKERNDCVENMHKKEIPTSAS